MIFKKEYVKFFFGKRPPIGGMHGISVFDYIKLEKLLRLGRFSKSIDYMSWYYWQWAISISGERAERIF